MKNTKYITSVFYTIILIFICSCNFNKKFDSKKWKAVDGNNFSKIREPYVNDLMENYLYKGLKYDSIIKLLGQPDAGRDVARGVGYCLYLEFDGIEPVLEKDLIIEISKDSLVTNYKVVTWEEHRH